MRTLLNTLYVTTQGSYLSRDGETVLVRVEKQSKLRVPVHTLGGIVCFGHVSCSPPLMELCGERNIAISFLSEQGKFYARVQGPISGNVLLRREQYRRADDTGTCADIARMMVIGKAANCRAVLLRAARDYPGSSNTQAIDAGASRLRHLIDVLQKSNPLEQIRGMEGDGARTYFDVFDHLIMAQKDAFYFRGRSRRPPLDNVNAMLSFAYTLLAHDVSAALQTVGLDPAVGFLHRDRPGRPGLALDLMEELRPVLADRLVLSLVNRQQVKANGFRATETGAVLMTDSTRKEFLIAYQGRKQEEIRHPFLNEKVALGLLPHVQALLFARFLRGDLDAYPPFLWK